MSLARSQRDVTAGEPLVDADGFSPTLYHALWRKNAQGQSCPGVNVPETVVFKYQKPVQWLFTSAVDRQLKRKHIRNVTNGNILEAFSKRRKSATLDICASHMIHLAFENHGQDDQSMAADTTSVEFFDARGVRNFVGRREKASQGLLQRFVEPKGDHNFLIRATWSPQVCLMERRINRHRIDDTKVDANSRLSTYEGGEHMSESSPVVGSLLAGRVQALCQAVAQHVADTSGQQIARMVLNFKVDPHDTIWFLYCSSLRVLQWWGGPCGSLNLGPHFVLRPCQELQERKYGPPVERHDTFVCTLTGKTCPTAEQCEVSFKTVMLHWSLQGPPDEGAGDSFALPPIPEAIARTVPGLTRVRYQQLRNDPTFLYRTTYVCQEACIMLNNLAIDQLEKENPGLHKRPAKPHRQGVETNTAGREQRSRPRSAFVDSAREEKRIRSVITAVSSAACKYKLYKVPFLPSRIGLPYSDRYRQNCSRAGNDYEAEPEDHKLAEREQQGSLIGGQVAAAGQAGTNTTSSFKQSTVDAKQLAASSGAPTPHNVWLYSLISADYEGAALLQHWITHYLLIGIEKERFLLLVNHNPANAGVQRAHLAEVLSILQQAGLGYRLWIGQYSSEGHLKLKLQILRDVIADPEDWIVMVDSDEFQIYSDPDVRRFLGECERQGQNWVRGFLQDRVSQTGDLLPIRPDVSIFEQFPRHCNVLRNTSGGKRKKVAAFKAYLRSNQGNHKLVQPEAAKQYFGPSQPGELGPRGGLLGGENLYPLTPYYTYHTRYMYPLTPNGTSGLWTPVMSSYFCLIQHFKWHHGVVRSVQDRLVYYKGDYNEQQGTGLPRYAHYIESQRILETVLAAGKIQVEEVECEKRANNPRYKAHS
ncbi:hypothetical protein WJX72_008263 [[Myrmecia] bisecta]|uniref:Glycosyltransferase family 92 protein n=1 Tax=[Myrmecia] bisecta TaxID=41462 RepID=A0AAW1Q578_9CHLO